LTGQRRNALELILMPGNVGAQHASVRCAELAANVGIGFPAVRVDVS
jgi:hypothetical protein